MKKYILVFLLLIASIGYSAEWNSNVQISCDYGVCVEGTPVNYTVAIANTGDERFTVRGITIKDSMGVEIAKLFNLNSTLDSNEYDLFSIRTVVPPAARGSTIIYDVCYIIESRGRTGEYCDFNKRYFSIKPLSEVECLSDNDCYEGKVCFNLKCEEKKELEDNGIGLYIAYINLALILGFIGYFIYWVRKKK